MRRAEKGAHRRSPREERIDTPSGWHTCTPMKPASFLKLACLIAAASVTTSLLGDVVETRGGTRLVGQIVAIDGTYVVLATDYAGQLKIKQSEVTGITSDTPLNVRTTGGTVVLGTVESSSAGTISVRGADGTWSTPIEKVSATWAPGEQDPAVVALLRRWHYEFAVDVTGKTGNKEQLGTAVAARATVKTPEDALQFYAMYDRQVSDSEKSADQFKAGVDYQNNFSGRWSWYVRDEGGFDRVKDIDLYNIAAAGLGYDFIKRPHHTLTGRVGLSFRYEGYGNPATEDVRSLGGDFGLNHMLDLGNSQLTNRISYVPLFEDYENYRILHESYFEIPLKDPSWKLRLGVSNDYNSQPGVGIEKLDTMYFTRFVLNWK